MVVGCSWKWREIKIATVHRGESEGGFLELVGLRNGPPYFIL